MMKYNRHFKNEKGVALATVLVLSLISLAIVSTLVYMVIQGTRFAGFHKIYKTALEASYGGTEIATSVIKNKGKLTIPGIVSLTAECDCGEPFNYTDHSPKTCFCAKICNPTFIGSAYNWAECGTICKDTSDPTCLDSTKNADMTFSLTGPGTEYEVYAKIVETTLGNSDMSGEDLGGTAVANSTAGVINAPALPYIYRIEVTGRDKRFASAGNLQERGRLSALYAY